MGHFPWVPGFPHPVWWEHWEASRATPQRFAACPSCPWRAARSRAGPLGGWRHVAERRQSSQNGGVQQSPCRGPGWQLPPQPRRAAQAEVAMPPLSPRGAWLGTFLATLFSLNSVFPKPVKLRHYEEDKL